MLDRLLLVSEEEREAAEGEQEPADVSLVVQLLVELLGPLRVAARQDPVALPLGDERRLEVRVGDRPAVAQVLRELERALDVLVRGDVVALAPVAARAPAEDVGAEQVAREARSARRATSASSNSAIAVAMLESL